MGSNKNKKNYNGQFLILSIKNLPLSHLSFSSGLIDPVIKANDDKGPAEKYFLYRPNKRVLLLDNAQWGSKTVTL